MQRRVATILVIVAAARLLMGQRPPTRSAAPKALSVVEATIPQLRAAMEEGRFTSRGIVQQYLARIARYEDRLNAAICLNPRALEEAGERDRERAQGRIRGPLHGIPIALKDNIHAAGMRTTGGALVFERLEPPYEATLTRNLRAAGAIIIAKTGMTELANWVASGMPGNYNGLTGYGMNPYDPRPDPRLGFADGRPALDVGGSSSGIGTASSFWAANVGTETSGSIISPANQNMLVGIKPTVGRVSRYGVIPITADQDSPGPVARTVTDAAILLGAMESGSPDPNDPATGACTPPPGRDYTRFLRKEGLRGARIGIPRAYFYDPVVLPGQSAPRGGLSRQEARIMSEAVAVLKRQGAVIVDPANLPSVVSRDPKRNAILWEACAGFEGAKGRDNNCSVVLKYGMKRDFNQWLSSLGAASPVKTLSQLRQWNLRNRKAGAIKYGQARLDISDEMDVEADRARYQADRAKDLLLSATHGIDAVMKEHRLDALLFPGAHGYSIPAKPGYPTIVVPFGLVENAPAPAFPEGFNAHPDPFGASFTGMACSEPRLIEIAYAFEQSTKKRVPPALR
ncbi:MAG: amidase [Acidimicrobiia bacterium]|nr:amidase [Acidimicrobiia bacterium]